MTAATPNNSARPPHADADLPVLREELPGFQPETLFLTTEKHTLGTKNPKPTTISRDITESRSLMSALKQLVAAAGIVAATGTKTTSNIKPTELALRTRNGRFFKEPLNTASNLEAVVHALDTRAQHAAKGLETVTLSEAAPAPATVSTIERAAAQTAPADTATAAAPVVDTPAVDVELPEATTGAERTVLLTPQDHLAMQEEHARAELDAILGGHKATLDNLLTPAAPQAAEPKKTLKQRILAGLPGALTSGAVVAATKVGVMSALGASVSAFALAPAITTIGGIGAGIFVGQSVAHLRERWNEAEAAKGEKISLKQIFKAAGKENISREWNAYRDAINNRDGKRFWRQALVKGTFAASIGAAIAWTPELTGLATEQLNKTTTGASVVKGLSSAFNTVSDKVSSGLSATKKFLTTSIFANNAPATPPADTTAASRSASGPITPLAPAATTTVPAAEAVTPGVEQLVPAAAPLDTVRAQLTEMGASERAINRLLNQTGVTEAQRINDVGVGLNNGIYGLPMNKDAARQMFEMARDMGNAKAATDLGVMNGTIAPPAPVQAPVETTAAAPEAAAPEAGSKITDAERRAAYEQVGLPFNETAPPAAADTPAPAIDPDRPLTKDDHPKRIGSEAARCVLEQVEKGRRAIRSLCTVFADVMQPKDTVLIEGKGLGTVPYTNDAEEAVDTESFMHASRRDFRDWSFVPWMKREAQ